MSGKVVRNQLKHKLVGTASGKNYDWQVQNLIKVRCWEIYFGLLTSIAVHSHTIRRHVNLYCCSYAKQQIRMVFKVPEQS